MKTTNCTVTRWIATPLILLAFKWISPTNSLLCYREKPMHNILRIILSVLVILVITGADQIQYSYGQQLRPDQSVVDYLKSKNRDPSFEARRKLFESNHPGVKYTGTEKQNIELLSDLLAEDAQARQSAAEATKRILEAEKERGKAQSERIIEKQKAVYRWVPAQGFGINGSYVVKVSAAVSDGCIRDRDFVVVVDSASARNGVLTFSGSVEIFVGNTQKPVQKVALQDAWFPTIRAKFDTTKWRYAAKGSVIKVPANQRVTARVVVHPVVKTTSGSVILRGHSIALVLSEN